MPNRSLESAVILMVTLVAGGCAQPEPAPSAEMGSAPVVDVAQVTSAVIAAVDAHWTAINAGDTAAIVDHHTADMTFFGPESDQLITFSAGGPAVEEVMKKFTGAKASWKPRDVKVQVFGDVAVASFFNDGSITYADGKTDQRTRRVTEVWARQADGTWKEAHHHDSPLSR